MRWALCLILSLAPALVASQSLVLVGGALSDDNAPVFERMIELAGGRGRAQIGILATASSDPKAEFEYFKAVLFKYYNFTDVTYIPVTANSGNGNDPFIADLVRSQTGIFFSGGDQARVINALRPNGKETFVLTAIKDVLRAGGMVGGTSAGTACQGDTVMVTGGYSWEGLVYGAFPGGYDDDNPYNLSYEEHGGLGLLSGYIPDSHFSERGREGRLIRLLQDTRSLPNVGTTRGLGVDENVALVVTDLFTRPTGTVLGTSGGVFFADVSNLVSRPSDTTDYDQVATHYLTLDDAIDLTTGVITFASWKSNMTGKENYDYAHVSGDILSYDIKREWAYSATRLFDSRLDYVVTHLSDETDPQFQVRFDRRQGVGFGGFMPSSPSTHVISYTNLLVGIRENPAKKANKRNARRSRQQV